MSVSFPSGPVSGLSICTCLRAVLCTSVCIALFIVAGHHALLAVLLDVLLHGSVCFFLSSCVSSSLSSLVTRGRGEGGVEAME